MPIHVDTQTHIKLAINVFLNFTNVTFNSTTITPSPLLFRPPQPGRPAALTSALWPGCDLTDSGPCQA